jgi:hypothetical protein
MDSNSLNNISHIIQIIEWIKFGELPSDFGSSDTIETYIAKKYIVISQSRTDDISWEQNLGI